MRDCSCSKDLVVVINRDIRVVLQFMFACEAVTYGIRLRTAERVRIRRVVRGYGV